MQQRVLTFLPKFELYIGEQYYGCICKEFTFFTPRFTLECSDWEVNGSFMEWDYTIDSASRGCIATITKEIFIGRTPTSSTSSTRRTRWAR